MPGLVSSLVLAPGRTEQALTLELKTVPEPEQPPLTNDL